MRLHVGLLARSAVVQHRHRLRPRRFAILALQLAFHVRVPGRETILPHARQRDIDVVRGVEPATPEPVEIDSRGIFHCPEEIRRCRALELPALRILLERKVEKLAPHHRLAQHGKGRSRLVVSVIAELNDRLGIGHDRNLVFRHHVRAYLVQRVRVVAEDRELLVPAQLRHPLEEGVDALIHPSPLPLVRVDDHREVVVPHLMNHDTDQAVARIARVRLHSRFLVLHRPIAVERNHRILHPATQPGVDRDRGRIGIGEGEF